MNDRLCHDRREESPEAKLKRQSIPFTEQEFVGRVKQGDLETVQLFLEAGMSPGTVDERHIKAVGWAISKRKPEMVSLLLGAGAKARVHVTANGMTGLMLAAKNGDTEIVKMLLEGGARINKQDDFGNTALMQAVTGRHVEIARMLLEAGANPNLATELPQVVERVLAGEDLASEILEQHRQTQLAYQRAIENGGPIEQDPASSKVLPATDPIALKMKQLWTNTQLSAPGNVLAINDPSGSCSFLAYDGWRSVIELNVEGQIIGKHVLPLPRMAAVSQLRSYLGGNGQRYYLAWSLRDFQAHVFDATWNRVLSYPPTTEKHDGVQDATMSDVDGDGQLELVVGFWGNQGVHCVSLEGTPRWINSDSPNVFSVLARHSDNRATQLCIAGAAGEPLFLNDRGQAATDAPQPPERIHHLFASHCGSNAALCGLSYGADGQRLVVGLDRTLQGTWRYRLPAGTFSTQVSFVTAAEILGSGQYDWLIAGPDGSVHIISGDGRFTDKFQTGEVLRGLAGGRQGDAGILVVSTQKGICAWSVTPPATAGQTRRGRQ